VASLPRPGVQTEKQWTILGDLNLISPETTFESVQIKTFILIRGHTTGIPDALEQVVTSKNPSDKEAISSLMVLGHGFHQGQKVSHVLLGLHTGRKHQLRLHCKFIGHPIIGDILYSNDLDVAKRAERMMLHAYSIEITFLRETGRFEKDSTHLFVSGDVLRPYIQDYTQFKRIEEIVEGKKELKMGDPTVT